MHAGFTGRHGKRTKTLGLRSGPARGLSIANRPFTVVIRINTRDIFELGELMDMVEKEAAMVAVVVGVTAGYALGFLVF